MNNKVFAIWKFQIHCLTKQLVLTIPSVFFLIRMLLLCQVQVPLYFQDFLGQMHANFRNGLPLPVFVQHPQSWKTLQEQIDVPFTDMPRQFFTEYKMFNTIRFAIIKPRALQICMQLHALELDANCMCEIVMAALEPTARELPFYFVWNLVTKAKHFLTRQRMNKFPAIVEKETEIDWQDVKDIGATIDWDYQNLTIFNISVCFDGHRYSARSLRKHSYFTPSEQYGFNFFRSCDAFPAFWAAVLAKVKE